MNWPDILVRANPDLAWSYSFEDQLRREVERAVRGVVGPWTFNTKSWTEIGAAVQVQHKELVNSMQALVPKKERGHGTVSDVQIIVLNGQPGSPHPEAPRMHGQFGEPWTYDNSRRGAHSLLDPVGLVWVDNFANTTLKEQLSVFETEMRNRGDVYVFELDKVTTCRHDSGQPPSWQSQRILLVIQKRPPLVVTLSHLSGCGDSNLEIACMNIGGDVLARIIVDPRSSCAAVRTSLAKELGFQEDAFQILSPSGHLMNKKLGSMPVNTFLSSGFASAHRSRMPPIEFQCHS